MDEDFHKLAPLSENDPHPAHAPAAQLPDVVLIADQTRGPQLAATIERSPLFVRHRLGHPDVGWHRSVVKLEESRPIGRQAGAGPRGGGGGGGGKGGGGAGKKAGPRPPHPPLAVALKPRARSHIGTDSLACRLDEY